METVCHGDHTSATEYGRVGFVYGVLVYSVHTYHCLRYLPIHDSLGSCSLPQLKFARSSPADPASSLKLEARKPDTHDTLTTLTTLGAQAVKLLNPN